MMVFLHVLIFDRLGFVDFQNFLDFGNVVFGALHCVEGSFPRKSSFPNLPAHVGVIFGWSLGNFFIDFEIYLLSIWDAISIGFCFGKLQKIDNNEANKISKQNGR